MADVEKLNDYFELNRREVMPFLPDLLERLLGVCCGNGAFGALAKARLDAEVWGVVARPDNASRKELQGG